ncbi:MAG TPA: sensor histidine kinase, partial [Blastocatellia bacterium]|nr:sensor histidine kinase [Blastocatellia bacterium]
GKLYPEVVEKTESLSALVGEMMKTVRRIATELRPGVLDTLGLVAAIEWQLQEFERSTGISTRFDNPGEDISIDDERATAVFRIFQEALTNVARHSEATEVEVGLGCRDNLLRLEVRDNGIGVTERQLRHSRSLGVLGMRERAKIFGGTLSIQGVEGAGTTAVLEMPLS